MHAHDYTRILRRWLLPAVLAACLVGAGSFFLSTRVLPREYTAKVVIQVELGLTTLSSSVDPNQSSSFAQTEANVAASRPVVDEAISRALAQPHMGGFAGDATNVEHSVSCSVDALTSLFTCSVTARGPHFAEEVANDLAQVFIETQRAWEQERYAPVLQSLAAAERLALKQNDQARYDTLVSREEDIRSADAQQSSNLRVVSPAVRPTAPSSPHVVVNTVLAALGALAIVLGLGTIFTRVDDSVHGIDDLREITSLPLLGAVPRLRSLSRKSLSRQSLIVSTNPRSTVSEAFRIIRAGIEFSRIDSPPRVILVTSALAGEGKSTLAANLAAAYAEEGKQVLLADLDLRRPSVATMFELPNRGVTNQLWERNYSAAYEVPSHLTNLQLLPSGPVPPNPAALLTSEHMTQLMMRLRSRFEIVILDSPPLLASADAAIAARLADCVVLVARPGRIKRRALLRAREALDGAGAVVAGVVANCLPGQEGSAYYYGYGYKSEPSEPHQLGPDAAPARRS